MISRDLINSFIAGFAGEELVLLPERAAFHRATATLYVADLHIGKSATFRAAAIPVPEGDTEQDLLRLGRALDRTAARRLVILGDFLHAPPGLRDAHWATWRSARPSLEVVVVRGNHDAHAGDPPDAWGVRLMDEPSVDGPFVLRHHPEASPDGPVLAGHLHPSIRLRSSGRDRLNLPCFVLGPRVGILPAFTAFAGGYPVVPQADDAVYAVAEDTVMDVTRIVA